MLADAVRAAGPGQPVWPWTADRSAGFWLRRMLHDEVVHRFDAEMALGIEGGLAADLAADGVSDVLDTMATSPTGTVATLPSWACGVAASPCSSSPRIPT